MMRHAADLLIRIYAATFCKIGLHRGYDLFTDYTGSSVMPHHSERVKRYCWCCDKQLERKIIW